MDPADHLVEGLRERKKRLTRQLLSDTATALLLERGFDGFRVADVAEACGVSEKTVYNYFPTKEALILDREEYVAEAIRHALGPEGEHGSPVEAIVGVLAQERKELRIGMTDFGDETGLAIFRRFMAMIEETPSLRAAAKEVSDRLARVAAEALADRAGVGPEEPEPTITAHALIGLWEVQQKALLRHAPSDTSIDEVYDRVEREVDRAARLIDTGLWSFSVVSGGGTRDQMRTAAESVQGAARQVATALRQAHKLWVEYGQAGADHPGHPGHAGHHWMGFDPESWDPDVDWREFQRETVQRWREAQRAHQQEWRQTKQRMKQELRDELRQAARARLRDG